MDFIHRPKSKILKILKNLNHKVSEAGSASVLRGMDVEKRRAPTLSQGPNRIAVLLFSPSIPLRTEAEPASETL
jgi:hypothetical protein